ncbi:MAG: GntG family PLP-dependent aldolase [Acidimicrobiales bacterium]
MKRRVDLRSDTVTQPTPAMREAIASATVGDVGYDEDPTVNELERRFAALVDKPQALFVPSGVMANQIALRVLTRPGDLVVAGTNQHVVNFEMGASARNSSIQFALVDDRDGVLHSRDVLDVIDAEQDHHPHVTLVAIENTHMFSGGTPWNLEQLGDLRESLGATALYLDGARLFNAVVATGVTAAQYSAPATMVMASLSKGLCAPVGSLLAGPAPLMAVAAIERKRLGGTMRQAGFLAAAGLVALETMIERLAKDHQRAGELARHVGAVFPESNYDPATCRTNIVAFDHPRARAIVGQLAERGVLAGTVGPRRVRLVTHAGVDDDDLAFAIDTMTDVARSAS